MKEQIKKEMSRAIGSYSNSLTDSIAERCTEIALKYIEQSRQAAVSGSLPHDEVLSFGKFIGHTYNTETWSDDEVDEKVKMAYKEFLAFCGRGNDR